MRVTMMSLSLLAVLVLLSVARCRSAAGQDIAEQFADKHTPQSHNRSFHFKFDEKRRGSRPKEVQCGVPAITPNINARIVGGEEAKPHSWPWQCWIQVTVPGGWILCGASVVNSNYLVTAAHCLFDENDRRIPATAYTTFCGDHNMNQKDGKEQRSGVARTVPHDKYTPTLSDYDVGVLELYTPLKLNDYVSPVCLPDKGVPEKTLCVVTGWGDTSEDGDVSSRLQQVSVPMMSYSACRRTVPGFTKNMVCAGYDQGGKDACQGDSGGPLVCKVNDRWELHGIVSFGEGCAKPGHPGVYTRVVAMKSWIASQTAKSTIRN